VELVTATSLMTVMMIGVIQIFAIITQTAGDAQGLQYALEQERAVFDMLHRDFDGMTHEGYLRIAKAWFQTNTNSDRTATAWTTPPATAAPPKLDAAPVLPPVPNVETWCACDTLAFTTVGYFEGMWDATNKKATGAEVVYTNNVLTPTTFLKVVPTSGATAIPVENRRGVLGRGVWMLSGPAGLGGDLDDQSKAGCMAELAIDTTKARSSSSNLIIYPIASTSGASDNQNSLKRVMACCTSEFFVEYYDSFKDVWVNPTSNLQWGAFASADPKLWPQRPRAIRVTVACHDPHDRHLLQVNENRFHGYALQEVFWISDP
jgi:hypothetical protein